MTSLDDLLNPRSIAIVGASDNPTRIGGRPLSHMIKQRFEGGVYPVNPKRDTVQGLKAYPSLMDIEADVDFVLVAVPAVDVAEVVRQAAAKRAKTVMVLSSGFAEIGGAGIAMQDELTVLARETGVRIIGPNCLGAFNAATRSIRPLRRPSTAGCLFPAALPSPASPAPMAATSTWSRICAASASAIG